MKDPLRVSAGRGGRADDAGVVNSKAYGPAVFDETSKFILEQHTDQGHIGVGETVRGASESSVRSSLSLLKDVELSAINLQDPPIVDLRDDDMFAHEHPGADRFEDSCSARKRQRHSRPSAGSAWKTVRPARECFDGRGLSQTSAC